jgi:hypothetical protein
MHHSAHLPSCVTPLLGYSLPIWWVHERVHFSVCRTCSVASGLPIVYKMILVHFYRVFMCGRPSCVTPLLEYSCVVLLAARSIL